MSNGRRLWLLPREAGEAGRGRLGRGDDDVEHRIDLGQHVVVPEAQDAVPPLGEPSRASGVPVLALHVLAAVEFDDEFGFGAGEVSDEWADRMLTTEASPVDLPAAQTAPQQTLGVGHVLAQLACSFDGAHGSW